MKNLGGFEPMLRDATIKAIDKVGEKLAGAEVTAENAVTRLLNRWNALDQQEKENVASVVIATAITADSAIAAIKKSGTKGAAKRAVKAVANRVKKGR
jgi:hypothetical protein